MEIKVYIEVDMSKGNVDITQVNVQRIGTISVKAIILMFSISATQLRCCQIVQKEGKYKI